MEILIETAINELSQQFDKTIPEEQKQLFHELFINYVKTRYKNLFDDIIKTNNQFLLNVVIRACQELIDSSLEIKKSYLLEDKKLIELQQLSSYVFEQATAKYKKQNICPLEELLKIKDKVLELSTQVEDYNKRIAEEILWETKFDLDYLINNSNNFSNRLNYFISKGENNNVRI